MFESHAKEKSYILDFLRNFNFTINISEVSKIWVVDARYIQFA